jgi:hypothetical protein
MPLIQARWHIPTTVACFYRFEVVESSSIALLVQESLVRLWPKGI